MTRGFTKLLSPASGKSMNHPSDEPICDSSSVQLDAPETPVTVLPPTDTTALLTSRRLPFTTVSVQE